MCFPVGEFVIGDVNVLLGVAAGRPEDVPLPAGDDLRFVTIFPPTSHKTAEALRPGMSWPTAQFPNQLQESRPCTHCPTPIQACFAGNGAGLTTLSESRVDPTPERHGRGGRLVS
jgi:hypothetical protein